MPTNLVILLEFLCFMHKNFKTYVRVLMVRRDDELYELRYGLIIEILLMRHKHISDEHQ